MTIFDNFMPNLDSENIVAILAYDGLCMFEFGIALEIFGLARPEFDFNWYKHRIVAVDPSPMLISEGIQVTSDFGLNSIKDAKTIVIPGWRSLEDRPPQELLDVLNSAYNSGARFISICSGAFVLAAAGLLDGKSATTHWRYTDELTNRYPQINVNPNVLYIDSGQIITSAGSAAGIDACLHLVSRDYGVHIANIVARRLVMSPQRSGGQIQFISFPVAAKPRDEIAFVIDWVLNNLQENISVKSMATKALMSERTFIRRFNASMGITPKAWVVQARINLARDLLESNKLSNQKIMELCGFCTMEGFRYTFSKAVGVSISSYRKQFGKQ